MDAKSVLTAYTEAVLNRHELERLDEFTTSEDLKKAARGFVGAFPDLHVNLDFLVAEDGVVGCRASGTGTHSGLPFRGLEPSGRTWAAPCNAFFQVREGKISQAWTIWDWASILKQIGG